MKDILKGHLENGLLITFQYFSSIKKKSFEIGVVVDLKNNLFSLCKP